ncbi:FAD-dependent monooxygenase [Devosia sediminis]|uniref:FAD-dependent monooxygenase n=1 Tax=Devosia sediminis TaxID=2798801 RepID=A0A934IY28_9HYPH|nr:FAD-dependent monooxygenase [Devosia sediminis]MBJ3784049.1 FAD-dependent monooxygenase [Devosia sediminis]
MPGTGRTFVIAGAGIAGMTLALALAQSGATVVVLERQAQVQEFGAGLQISPNARKCLDRLGLAEALDRIGLEPQALDIYPQGGQKPLLSMELGAIMRKRFGAPYMVMHRADLADALYKACRKNANIDILFGVRNWDVVSHTRGVTVSIDEADGMTRTTRAEAFIGADGVHSHTRLAVLDGPRAQFRNRIAWRTLVPFDLVSGQIAPDRVSVFFGSGFHLVCYPLPHRGQVNLALFMPGTPETTAQPRPANPGPRVEAILAAAAQGWTAWPMYTVETGVWHKGNIGLVGDAAHAMVPFQAQGAAMGIEDATVLAACLLGTDSTSAAFSRYAAHRQQRVRRVAALSARNGRIFHLPWPLSLARDTVMRLQGPQAHLRRLDWVYAHDAAGQIGGPE